MNGYTVQESLERASRFVMVAHQISQSEGDNTSKQIIKSIIEDETVADEPKVEDKPEEEEMVYPPPRDVLYATVMAKSDEIKYGKPVKIYSFNGHSWPIEEHLNEPRDATHCLNCRESYASPASLPGNPCKGKKTEEPIDDFKNESFVKVHKFEKVPRIKWLKEMDQFVGQIGRILYPGYGDFKVEFSNFDSFWFPRSALELFQPHSNREFEEETRIKRAITHCYEVAKTCDCECGKEHTQLAEWLNELLYWREKNQTIA